MNDTGGPAFPVMDMEVTKEGMTLRDYFAAKAIGVEDVTLRPAYTFEEKAKYAYMMADAMMKAREQ